MKIGIMSDSHDHWDKLKKALELADQEGCEQLIFCGDLCAPATMKICLGPWGKPVHLVFGNVDGDRYLITKLVYEECKNIKIYGNLGELKLGGRNLAFTHEPIFAGGLAACNCYDAVFYGHNHQAKVAKSGKTLLANPGAVSGLGAEKASFGVYNTESGEMEVIVIS